MTISILKNTHVFWPQWFSIENYQCLENLTIEQFIDELEVRLHLFHANKNTNGRVTDERKWKMIESGQVILADKYLPQMDFEGVKALNQLDVACINEEFKNQHSENYHEMELEYLLPVVGTNKKFAVVAIDLVNFDNNSLIYNFKQLIEILREKENIPEPKMADGRSAKEGTFKKLLTYRLIPYLDLCLYCYNYTKNKTDKWKPLSFTQGAYINLLFNDEIDCEAFKKTYMPFYRDVIEDEAYLVKLLSNVRGSNFYRSSLINQL